MLPSLPAWPELESSGEDVSSEGLPPPDWPACRSVEAWLMIGAAHPTMAGPAVYRRALSKPTSSIPLLAGVCLSSCLLEFMPWLSSVMEGTCRPVKPFPLYAAFGQCLVSEIETERRQETERGVLVRSSLFPKS